MSGIRVGVPTEIKTAERRVALTPAGVELLAGAGHEVTVQSGAGAGAGLPDALYEAAGARLEPDADVVWRDSDLVVKVKEPVEAEYGRLRTDLTLFTYLHLAADRPLTEALVESGTTGVAYETVEDERGGLPLLAPMSEVAGRLAAYAAAHHLRSPEGGPGLLMGGVPGVAPARVLIIGGGVVGTQAARMAVGMEADVTILERSLARIKALDELFQGRATVLASDPETLASSLALADVVIGAVLVPGAAAPRVLTREMLPRLKPGALLVDVAIDQGGCFETSRATTHDDPTYIVDGVVHYCVANMPGSVPTTSTRALTNATLPHVLRLVERMDDGGSWDSALASGLNVADGRITQPAVAAAFPDLPSGLGGERVVA
jgi:alanine dehydrogenase